MLDTGPVTDTRRQLERLMQLMRRMPAASRQAMDDEARVIGDRIARAMDQATGSVPYPGRVFATRMRAGGIQVKPGRGELQIVVGGARASGIGRLKMRDLVLGAEFGGGGRVTAYSQRRRRATVHVRRRVTTQFGRHAPDGRFAYPTWNTEAPAALEDWAAAVERTIVDYWQEVASA